MAVELVLCSALLYLGFDEISLFDVSIRITILGTRSEVQQLREMGVQNVADLIGRLSFGQIITVLARSQSPAQIVIFVEETYSFFRLFTNLS